jgi:hypothetical protein
MGTQKILLVRFVFATDAECEREKKKRKKFPTDGVKHNEGLPKKKKQKISWVTCRSGSLGIGAGLWQAAGIESRLFFSSSSGA